MEQNILSVQENCSPTPRFLLTRPLIFYSPLPNSSKFWIPWIIEKQNRNSWGEMLISQELASPHFSLQSLPWLRLQSPLQLNRLDLTELSADINRIWIVSHSCHQSSLYTGGSTSPIQCLLQMDFIDHTWNYPLGTLATLKAYTGRMDMQGPTVGVLPTPTENYTKYPMINHNGKEF